MGTLIDSSILIAAERGSLDMARLLKESGDIGLAISAVTAAELLHGVHRASTKHQKALREAFIERLLELWPALPFDLTAARMHARLWAGLSAKGVSIGSHDLMIAATALANGLALATRDKRSFLKVPGLKVLHW
ncbi:MAG TPA: type II toxin-antitoxin system VapC family toxin [Bryobacteraceae bacterium]|jgi:tRNA(fMet)-specific endonuclease VapC|nr:type II toxin-antitoxin system VapC family toxin [Bryobacteraceae bacterium]